MAWHAWIFFLHGSTHKVLRWTQVFFGVPTLLNLASTKREKLRANWWIIKIKKIKNHLVGGVTTPYDFCILTQMLMVTTHNDSCWLPRAPAWNIISRKIIVDWNNEIQLVNWCKEPGDGNGCKNSKCHSIIIGVMGKVWATFNDYID